MAPTYITRGEASEGLVLRALRPDVPVPAWTFAAAGPAAAAYEVMAEDGDVDGAGGVRLVETFAALEEVRAWAAVHALFRERRGYLGTRLFRGADHVALMRWSSPLMYQRAMQEPSIAAAVASLGFTRQAALYLPVEPGPAPSATSAR